MYDQKACVMVPRHKLPLLVLPFVLLLVCAAAWAQSATGEFLCSAGSKDGRPCNSDDDCPGGVCVVAQGVCVAGDDDGQLCSCPSGTCSVQTSCSEPASVAGVCSGGTSAGASCTCSCAGQQACTGTQKVCLGGAYRAFSCLRDDQCAGSHCGSTGLVCADNTDFFSFSCLTDSDCCNSPKVCPVGSCEGAVVQPTLTPTRSASVVATPPGTPGPGAGVLAQGADAGATIIELVDASNFPASGWVRIGNDPTPVPYTRTPPRNTLHFDAPYALSRHFDAGTVVTLTQVGGNGGEIHVSTAEGCSVHRAGRHQSFLVVAVALALWGFRRVGSRSEPTGSRQRGY
jgi:hypothetical protein